jgi:hypothetical protein
MINIGKCVCESRNIGIEITLGKKELISLFIPNLWYWRELPMKYMFKVLRFETSVMYRMFGIELLVLKEDIETVEPYWEDYIEDTEGI